MVALANSASAQSCPSNIPPIGIAWGDGPCYDVPIYGGSPGQCVEHVCTCKRIVDAIAQFSIKSITPAPGSETNCGPIDWGDVIKETITGTAASITATVNTFLPCPGDGTTSISFVNNTCWEIININTDPNLPPLMECHACTDQSGYCQKNWSVCIDQNGFPVTTLVSSSFSAGNCATDPGHNWPRAHAIQYISVTDPSHVLYNAYSH